jgi:hypothetical protein
MVNGFEPRVLICCECEEEFVFTVKAQQYFAERGYTEDPKRCKACYTQFKKSQRSCKAAAVTAASEEHGY